MSYKYFITTFLLAFMLCYLGIAQTKQSNVKAKSSIQNVYTKNELLKVVSDIIREIMQLDKTTFIDLKSDFRKTFGADDLDHVELIMSIEKKFNILIPDEVAINLIVVGDIVNYLHSMQLKK